MVTHKTELDPRRHSCQHLGRPRFGLFYDASEPFTVTGLVAEDQTTYELEIVNGPTLGGTSTVRALGFSPDGGNDFARVVLVFRDDDGVIIETQIQELPYKAWDHPDDVEPPFDVERTVDVQAVPGATTVEVMRG